MNDLLNKAELWLSEMGIKTEARPTCLMVSRDNVENLCGDVHNDFINELRTAVGSKTFILTHRDDEWLYIETL